MKILVGTSGWIYKDWAERFYPKDLKSSEEKLKFFAGHFPTVEINNSFYRLPNDNTFKHWRETAPRGFIFSVKLSRFLTHIKRLKADDRTNEGVDRFASRVLCLREALGAVLVQLPTNFKSDLLKIENLALQFKEAEKKYNKYFPLAVEFRHDSWFRNDVYEVLKKHNIASVINSAPDWPASKEVTADFAYIRFHGSKKLYASSYSFKELDEWVEFIKKDLGKCKIVYCYFNNDQSARAVDNASYLISKFSH